MVIKCDVCEQQAATAWEQRRGRGFASRVTGTRKYSCDSHRRVLWDIIKTELKTALPYTSWNSIPVDWPY